MIFSEVSLYVMLTTAMLVMLFVACTRVKISNLVCLEVIPVGRKSYALESSGPVQSLSYV
jgi:hypothetical protein